MTRRLVLALLLSLLLPALAPAQEAPQAQTRKGTKKGRVQPAFQPVEDQPGLPRVLLIGDSISIGYTLGVREELEGVANVHRIPTNGGPTPNGLANLEKWLGNQKWDLIHFNWGLHDLKYVDEQGQLVEVAQGKPQVNLEAYERNLRELVNRLQQTGAKLIWCSTTPVPEGARGRVPGSERAYNEVAAMVMQDEGVAVNDLCAFAEPRLAAIQLPQNVHFSAEGSTTLAKQVAAAIRGGLAK